jgi:hypothetical protein
MSSFALFELISSLTMSEKRYFKLFSSRHVIGESNDYIHLFNAIDRQHIYSEVALKKASFVKNLSQEKNYLYRLVLKSLNAYHSSLNNKSKIFEYLKQVEILFHKGLYEQALKIVKKAKKIAFDNDLFNHELIIHEIEAEILSKQLLYNNALLNFERHDKLLDISINFSSIQKIAFSSYENGLMLGEVRSDSDMGIMKKFVLSDEIKDDKLVLSSRAEMYRLSVLLAYYYMVKDEKEMLFYSEKLTTHYRLNPSLIEYSTMGYIFSISSHIRALIQNDSTDKAWKELEVLENLENELNINNSINLQARVFIYSLNLRIELYILFNKHDKCAEWIERKKNELVKFECFISKPFLYECYFLMAKHYFITGNYKKALLYSNKIINDIDFKLRADILSEIRLLNLLIHFELNNNFTLKYLTKNTLNYLKSKKRFYKLEDELIRFMKHQQKSKTGLLENDLMQLKKQMQFWMTQDYESIPFKKFDFGLWAEAKLKNKFISQL